MKTYKIVFSILVIATFVVFYTLSISDNKVLLSDLNDLMLVVCSGATVITLAVAFFLKRHRDFILALALIPTTMLLTSLAAGDLARGLRGEFLFTFLTACLTFIYGFKLISEYFRRYRVIGLMVFKSK